jgi:hypothetical protein
MEDRPLGNGSPEHLLQANCLPGNLDVVAGSLAPGAVLELDRENRAVRVELHKVCLADQADPIRPEGQGAFDFDSRSDLVTGLIHEVVNGTPSHRVDVLLEIPL